MSKGNSDKITYKPYEQDQQYLIPPSARVTSWTAPKNVVYYSDYVQ